MMLSFDSKEVMTGPRLSDWTEWMYPTGRGKSVAVAVAVQPDLHR